MPRLAIMTVGETHSGKSTFAQLLHSKLKNSIVLDQDTVATFINANYSRLVPKSQPNLLKPSVSDTILSYALEHSDAHVILCNSNRSRTARDEMMRRLVKAGLATVLVFFDLSPSELRSRVQGTKRDPSVLRVASDFSEVLERQLAEKTRGGWPPPSCDEVDHYFCLSSVLGIPDTIEKIVAISTAAR